MKDVEFISPDLSHTTDIINLVEGTARLDANSDYAYALWCSQFSEHSVVAVRDGETLGFLTGFRSPRNPETYFLWQTATKPRHGIAGLGVDMIEFAVRREIERGATKIEASVDESNTPIRLIMKTLGKRFGGRVEEKLLYPGSLLSRDGQDHHDETLMRVLIEESNIPVAPAGTSGAPRLSEVRT